MFIRDEPALPLPPLRPGIRIEKIGLVDRVLRETRDQPGRVLIPDADVSKVLVSNHGEQLRHAVHKRLTTDEPDVRMSPGPGRQVLTAAEPDLERDRARHKRE